MARMVGMANRMEMARAPKEPKQISQKLLSPSPIRVITVAAIAISNGTDIFMGVRGGMTAISSLWGSAKDAKSGSGL